MTADSQLTHRGGPGQDVKHDQTASSSSVNIDTVEAPGERRVWGRHLEYVLTLIGFAVGLGNVWRFPYLAYQNGGGAFLIPYFIVMVFIGLPMYFMDLSLGQFSSSGPLAVWSINPMFKGLGVSMMIITATVVCCYNVIAAWCLYYFFASMTTELPWRYCNNWWNTNACIDETMNMSQVIVNGTMNGLRPTTAAEEYFYNNVLRLSAGLEHPGTIVWQLACLLFLAWLIIFLVIIKGIASVGKVSYFVTLFPYVLLTVLLGQSAALDGSLDGIKYYMIPQWERLKDAQVWGNAVTQIFYSTGICTGCLIAMSSFNKFNTNLQRDSIVIPIVNCLTSVYAGFVVFAMLGHIAKIKNLPIDQVAQAGPGLIFVVYPEGLTFLPVAPLWSVLFFFMMTILGFSSQFSVAEALCSALTDEYPVLLKGKNPLLLRGAYCLLNFLLALPMITEGGFYLFNMVNEYGASYAMLITAFFEIVVVAWIYGFRQFMTDIEMMLGHKPSYFWVICWVVIAPLLILCVIVFNALQQPPLQFGDYVYPDWGNAIAWMIVAFPLVMIVGWMLGEFFYQGGAAVCIKINRPSKHWGPVLEENRTGKYARNEINSDHHLTYVEKIAYGFDPEKEISNSTGFANKAYDTSYDDEITTDGIITQF